MLLPRVRSPFVTAGEVAAIIAAVALAILSVGMLFALASLVTTLRTLRESVEVFRAESLPLVSELRGTVNQANGELERVDNLLATAESVGATVDSASKLAYIFFANPVVKVLAFGAGTGRAYRRLRRGQQ
ncbi:MAG TPA: DUF948 domain-containing protein [Acidimicrobiales bacterium]|jgi:hypothetical protein|nr:DUF948 domain-containing protein [Acidimicrobiales bacterium]